MYILRCKTLALNRISRREEMLKCITLGAVLCSNEVPFSRYDFSNWSVK